MSFDHLGLVVKSVAGARKKMAAALQISLWTDVVKDPVNGVTLQFGRDPAGVVYELLEPLGDDSPVANALSGGKAILNHVAYGTSDLATAAAHLRATGNSPVGTSKPAIAYGGAHIQFFVTPLRFLIELVEAPAYQHAWRAADRP